MQGGCAEPAQDVPSQAGVSAWKGAGGERRRMRK